MDSQSHIRSLQTIYLIMIGIAVAFGAVALSLGGILEEPAREQIEGILTIVFTALTAIELILSFWLPNRMMASKESAHAAERLAAYRQGKTTAAALCQGPALMWGVLILLSGNIWYALPMAICITALMTRFPTMMELEALFGKRQPDIDRALAAR